jgi:two-component system cell cycle sensor histidine kinase/response regulator CckA
LTPPFVREILSRGEEPLPTAEIRAELRPFELLDDFPDPVVVVDRGGGVVYASHAAEASLGPGGALAGVDLMGFVSAEDRPGLTRMLGSLADHPGPERVEAQLIGPGGTARSWEIVGRRVDHGGCSLFLLAARDRTIGPRRLEEQQLQTIKMDAVGRLAGGIAHEFNNLLTTIIGASELLGLRLSGMPEVTPELHAIRTASDRAASLVRRLLTFARRGSANPQVIDLVDAVRGAHRILASALGEDVDLDIRTPAGTCTARVDPAQIEQVLLNLVINARDAMPAAGGRVSISVAEERLIEPVADLAPGEYVKLCVSDNGSGMNREVLERIFEPFFTTKPREHGSGLGLSIVYGIVRQSGGHVLVDSALGSGSTFTLYLPHVKASASQGPPIELTPAPRGSETILVVEDDEMVRGITVRALRQLGYRILLAEDGVDALRVVAQHGSPIDLVLTDIIMPHMGGPELVEKLLERYPGLKVLFVSGYSEESLADRGILAEHRAFLDKPFTSSMLARKMREILDKDPRPLSPRPPGRR